MGNEDLNQRFVSSVGKELEASRREVERLQLEVVELRQRLAAVGDDRLIPTKTFCDNCGHPAHNYLIHDKPEVPSGD